MNQEICGVKRHNYSCDRSCWPKQHAPDQIMFNKSDFLNTLRIGRCLTESKASSNVFSMLSLHKIALGVIYEPTMDPPSLSRTSADTERTKITKTNICTRPLYTPSSINRKFKETLELIQLIKSKVASRVDRERAPISSSSPAL